MNRPWLVRRRTLLVGMAGLLLPVMATAGEASTPAPTDWGIWSLLPPLVAIGLAIATRRVVLALLLAVTTSALLLAGGRPLAALAQLAFFLWQSLKDSGHLHVYAFTLMMGAMVGVVNRAGGMHGLVERIAPWAGTRQRGQLTGWALGLLIFFDDYANTLLLGSTLRPLFDRLRLSREKLAFIVDATAAPVAGLALVSTWVAGEISYITQGLKGIEVGQGQTADAFSLFVSTLAYRFYPWWAIFFVALVAWLGRDFGPMLHAERRARRGEHEGASPTDLAVEGHLLPAMATPRRWFNAVVPVLVVLAVVTGVLVQTGLASLAADASHPPRTLMNIIGSGDSYAALVWASLAGWAVALILIATQRLLAVADTVRASLLGAWLMMPALLILWLAWALSDSTGDAHLRTAHYLGQLLDQVVAARWLPTLVFLLAAAVAFSTGTSWGTMSILTPLVIQVGWRLLGGEAAARIDDPIFVATVGAVLAGSIFGDHCSPLSDTTVLSSRASGCDHIAHVRTQMPYALVVAAVCILCGTIPVGLGIPVWPMWLVGSLVLLAVVRLLGKTVDVP